MKKIKTKTFLAVSGATLGFAGLVMAVAMPLGAKATVGGPICNVPTDYATIQGAVNVPGCTTINVAAGVYPENVTIDHALILNGAQANNPVAGRTFSSLTESTISGTLLDSPDITITAANVTVNGFSITNPGHGTGVDIKTAGDTALITNNIIDTIGGASFTPNTQAVYLELGPDNVSVVNNRMSHIQSTTLTSNGGVLIGDSTSTNPSVDATITGNTISDITSNRGAYAVHVNNGNGATANSGLVVNNNTISNLNGVSWVHAIGLEANTPDVVVTGNSISTLNTASPDAIAVWFEANPSFASGEVHNNNLNQPTTQFGIAVQPSIVGTGAVDGTCNWWNSSTGPTSTTNPGGTGAQVGPRVTFSPWLTAPAPGGLCIGGHIVTNKDQCKKDGWTTLFRTDGTTFKNQGDCVSYTNNGR